MKSRKIILLCLLSFFAYAERTNQRCPDHIRAKAEIRNDVARRFGTKAARDNFSWQLACFFDDQLTDPQLFEALEIYLDKQYGSHYTVHPLNDGSKTYQILPSARGRFGRVARFLSEIDSTLEYYPHTLNSQALGTWNAVRRELSPAVNELLHDVPGKVTQHELLHAIASYLFRQGSTVTLFQSYVIDLEKVEAHDTRPDGALVSFEELLPLSFDLSLEAEQAARYARRESTLPGELEKFARLAKARLKTRRSVLETMAAQLDNSTTITTGRLHPIRHVAREGSRSFEKITELENVLAERGIKWASAHFGKRIFSYPIRRGIAAREVRSAFQQKFFGLRNLLRQLDQQLDAIQALDIKPGSRKKKGEEILRVARAPLQTCLQYFREDPGGGDLVVNAYQNLFQRATQAMYVD